MYVHAADINSMHRETSEHSLQVSAMHLCGSDLFFVGCKEELVCSKSAVVNYLCQQA